MRSKRGKGTVFCITFEVQKVGKTQDIPHNNENNNINYTGRTILVAEDVDINQEIIEYFLKMTNASVELVKNGQQVVQAFLEAPEKYDLIFMDIQMPEMDGYEATRIIRNSDHPAAKTVPIIAMTANVLKEDIERCLAAGMNDHIGKPFEADVVFSTMKKAFAE